MIGTRVGLVQMLKTVADPSKVGADMAVALLTTLYGAIIANVACIAMAGKLEGRSPEEVTVRGQVFQMFRLTDTQMTQIRFTSKLWLCADAERRTMSFVLAKLATAE